MSQILNERMVSLNEEALSLNMRYLTYVNAL